MVGYKRFRRVRRRRHVLRPRFKRRGRWTRRYRRTRRMRPMTKRFIRRRGFTAFRQGHKKLVKLHYRTVEDVSVPVNEYITIVSPVKLDSCYDPHYGATGAFNVSSAGYDYYSKFYKAYRVVSAKVKITMNYVQGQGAFLPIVAGAFVDQFPGIGYPTLPSWMQLAKRGGCRYVMDVGEHRMKSMRLYWSRNAVVDRDHRYATTPIDTDPIAPTALNLFVSTMSMARLSATPSVIVKFNVSVTQYVEFSGAAQFEIDGRVQEKSGV